MPRAFSGVHVERTKFILFVLTGARLGARRHLLHAALRQRPRRQRDRASSCTVIAAVAARRRLDLRRPRCAPRRHRRRPAHRRARQRAPPGQRHLRRHQHHHRRAARALGGGHQLPRPGCSSARQGISEEHTRVEASAARVTRPRTRRCDHPSTHHERKNNDVSQASTASRRTRGARGERRAPRHRLRRTTPAPAAARQWRRRGNLAITFLPKNLGNPYFDTSRRGRQGGHRRVRRHLRRGRSRRGARPTPRSATSTPLTQQGVGAIVVSANDPEAICDALERGSRRRRQGRHLRLRHQRPTAATCSSTRPTPTASPRSQVDLIAEQIGDAGEIAILSASANATNQNAWIETHEGATSQPTTRTSSSSTPSTATTTTRPRSTRPRRCCRPTPT